MRTFQCDWVGFSTVSRDAIAARMGTMRILAIDMKINFIITEILGLKSGIEIVQRSTIDEMGDRALATAKVRNGK